jgi:hypothetical protein
MKKYRYKEAFASFSRLRNTELIAARELVGVLDYHNQYPLANLLPIEFGNYLPYPASVER